MSIATATTVFRTMSQADKAALKELQDAEEKRTGKKISLHDIIHAVTPGLPDPAYLKG